MQRYNPKEIEPKWQQKWAEDKTYYVDLQDATKQRFYGFAMLPYPSGTGLHTGHVRTYTLADLTVRAKRQQGYNAYNPIGWDAFGLPAENYAIKTGTSPQETIQKATSRFREQLTRIGMSHDWSKEINTSDPQYYRWTQWVFAQLFKQGLAYQKESAQWWCPVDQTVLANEQVEAGKCWRCGSQVEKKLLKQWFFKITDYADELLESAEALDWPNSIKTMQRNWIGRSQGAEIEFIVPRSDKFEEDYVLDGSMEDMPSGKQSNVYFAEGEPKKEAGKYFKLTHYETKRAYALAKITETKAVRFGTFSPEQQRSILSHGDSYNSDTLFTSYAYEIHADILNVFTTRPDTLFGATFMVAAPEHPIVQTITTDENREAVEDYIKQAQTKTDIQRQETDREKTGVFTGAYATNPVNSAKIPVWIADYVLYGYGTGAIMAVPSHDERDYAFAKKSDLPITQVIARELTDLTNPPREGYETVSRRTVHCVVKHPTEDEYLVLNWADHDWNTFIIGGVEEDESFEAAGKREITEETGYQNIRYVRQLSDTMFANYHATHKVVNRRAEVNGLLFELENLEKGEVADSERNRHEPRWVPADKLKEAVSTGVEPPIFIDALFNGDSIFTEEGVLINSEDYDGLQSSEARERIVADLETKGNGKAVTNYKIRDWLISRQRYWGAPIPIVHCEKDGAVLVPDDQLPVELPIVEKYQPDGGHTSVLAGVDEWVNTFCPKCGGPAKRETDTMDGYACSSWYFLRYLDPHNDTQAWDPAVINRWMPINFYNGADHAVSHLLYARFWTHFFHKIGLISDPEPVKRLVYNAYILAPDGTKMSKSKGNVVDPLEIVDSGYGADALRVYEMFIAPYDLEAPWDTRGVPGCYRFLQRTWNLVQAYAECPVDSDENPPAGDNSSRDELVRVAHKTVKKVTVDIEATKFNTSVAAMMEAVNAYMKLKENYPMSRSPEWQYAIESLVMLVAPFAPHMADELWSQLGKTSSVHVDNWPTFDERHLSQNAAVVIVQINGKLRASLTVALDKPEFEVVEEAKADPNVTKHLVDKTIVKTVYVPGKIVNFVVK